MKSFRIDEEKYLSDQEIIAEHFKVDKDSVIMHMSTATVKLPSTAKEGKENETD